MAKYRTDEGSNSDSSSGSLKEITADDFKQQDSRSRVWIYNHPAHRNYNQDLYSFAWAQAVQNKPLGIAVKPLKVDDEDEVEMFVEVNEDVGEKEEGEIEEGEIDLVLASATNLESKEEKVDEVEKDLDLEEKVDEIGEFDKRFGVILEELETITVEEAQASFEEVCSRLQKCFASLKEMFLEGHGPILDVLAQQAFVGIQTVCSAYNSGNLKKMDHNKELLLRLLIHIKNQYSVFLSSEQVKEMDVRVHALVSEAVSITKTTGNMNGSPFLAERAAGITRGSNSVGNNIGRTSLPTLQLSTSSRSRVDFSPLLNLHEDYDEDNLPSPTRDNAPPLPVLKPIGFGIGAPAPAQSTILPKHVGAENSTLHLYVSHAFKAVSSYQQKYGKNSILTNNRLPSPTPSEDGNDGDDDVNGEVSSSAVASNARTFGPRITTSTDNLVSLPQMPQMAFAKTIGQVGLEPNPVMNASAKSRDPRLRFLIPEVVSDPQNGLAAGLTNSRKHKAVDEPVQDDHNLKRQRNGSVNPRDVPVTVVGGGWIEDKGIAPYQTNKNVGVGSRNMIGGEVGSDKSVNANYNLNGSNGVSVPNMTNSTSPAVSLPSLLKDIAVNPAMLMQLVKMEQQRIAAEGQNKAAGPSVSGLSCVIPPASEIGKNPATKPHMPAQTTPMNGTGKIRMKPRDPRRILHANVVQKRVSSVGEPTKASVRLSSEVHNGKDDLTVREQGEKAHTTIVPKNLQNFANIVSSSPVPSGTQNTTQSIASKISNGPTETKGETTNSWGDMDHLLEGYDDQEKAAIQKERARRISEQNKMFAARKLCLVLDLDHTLLNSAKFGEVDQVHEEILRKKEEQDKQKSERHLYRFPHMGMWTKLRPGVWKFLEKASQLYELHLYTMGNKLYATEMAKILDPTGKLFSGRVISRGDDDDSIDGEDRVPKSKDLDGVLGMESAVVIVDDSVRVWPHNKLNLIAVERYTYFPISRRQFGLLGPSLLEIDHDERPEDGTLASSLAVIERIHQKFFSHQSLNEVDVRNILAAEQRKILGGCKIVFSRVFPVGEANFYRHPLWQTAEQFGAECTNQIDEHVTHVVANSLGTDKVNWALSTGRFVVHPGWVEASALLYRRANEQEFAVKT